MQCRASSLSAPWLLPDRAVSASQKSSDSPPSRSLQSTSSVASSSPSACCRCLRKGSGRRTGHVRKPRCLIVFGCLDLLYHSVARAVLSGDVARWQYLWHWRDGYRGGDDPRQSAGGQLLADRHRDPCRWRSRDLYLATNPNDGIAAAGGGVPQPGRPCRRLRGFL